MSHFASENEPEDWQPPILEVIATGELTCSLEEAALHLARQEYPALDVAASLGSLDEHAARARRMLSAQADAPETIGVLNDVLFQELGFCGNTKSYYDPRNSFLNDVLERRTGIPISLSTVYMAVARRLGLEVHGTAFPGHFVVRVDRPGWPIIVDPFTGGRILDEEECRARAARLDVEWSTGLIDKVDAPHVLRRMLNNLKMIYFDKRDWGRLLRTTLQIRVVTPEDHDEHFTLGVAWAALGRIGDSIRELQRYLELRPQASNRAEVLHLLQDLRGRSN